MENILNRMRNHPTVDRSERVSCDQKNVYIRRIAHVNNIDANSCDLNFIL